MNPSWMAVYGSLPGPLKSVAASLRGWSLRRLRYGPDTERLVEEAFEREQWAPPRWKAWQEERIAAIPAGINGKFQAVVCRVAAGDRAAAACE